MGIVKLSRMTLPGIIFAMEPLSRSRRRPVVDARQYTIYTLLNKGLTAPATSVAGRLCKRSVAATMELDPRRRQAEAKKAMRAIDHSRWTNLEGALP
jgi:hypothetical protein